MLDGQETVKKKTGLHWMSISSWCKQISCVQRKRLKNGGNKKKGERTKVAGPIVLSSHSDV